MKTLHDSAVYGASTELLCAAQLIERGWEVAFPFIESSAIDLIAFREGTFITIQVKSGRRIVNGSAIISKQFTKYAGVDFIICYDVINRRWFIFEFKELDGRGSVTLSPRKYTRNHENWDLLR